MIRLVVILIFLSVLGGCGQKKYSPPSANISAKDSPTVKKLYSHYNEWRGVRYREGGMSKKGVDCSAFVHIAYKEKLHKNIPRSTELMSQTGKKVSMKNLRPGDVVFFKTGFKVRHVGIYVGKGEFIHASSSRGVMKSKLNNPYWIDAYWMSRRY
ncbi:MAG: NlpC/P60 family protein [Methylococcales bacterium]